MISVKKFSHNDECEYHVKNIIKREKNSLN